MHRTITFQKKSDDLYTIGLYYNRNRWYAPHLGRFLQRDPLQSGLVTAKLTTQLDSTLLIPSPTEPAKYYAYGCNSYDYLGSNPNGRFDPTGEKWYTLNVGNVAFLAGSFFGSSYAAYHLNNPKPGMISWGHAVSAAAGWIAKSLASQPLLNYGVATVRNSTKSSSRLLYEAMNQSEGGGAFGASIIKNAINFLVGVSTGQLGYTMYTLFEEGQY